MRLELYVLRQLFVALAFAVVGLLFVALPGIAVSAVHRLPQTDTLVLVRYLPIVLQNLVPYVLPICFLLALVSTFGRLAADNEWTAIQMAGVNPLRLLAPPLGVAVALGATTYWMMAYELPKSKEREKRFLVEAATSSISNLAPGRTSLQLGGFYVDGAFRDGPVFRDVLIHKPGKGHDEDFKAFARSAKLTIEDEVLYVDLTEVQPVGPSGEWAGLLGRMQVTVPLSEFVTQKEESFGSPRYRTSTEIRRRIAQGDMSEKQHNRYLYEFHNRMAASSSFLLFLVLGAPTGLLLRRGTRIAALATAVGYALVYYVLSMRFGRELGRGGFIPPAAGAWSTNVVGTLLALGLLRKAMRR